MMEGPPQKVFSYQGYRAPYQYVADANMWEGGIHRGRGYFILAFSKAEASSQLRPIRSRYQKALFFQLLC